MNLELRNSGREGTSFRHFQRTGLLGQIAGRNRPFSSRLEREGHPFNPRPGFTGLMLE
jgi:hypothetical protein